MRTAIYVSILALFIGGVALAAEPIGQVVAVQKEVSATDPDGAVRELEMKSPIYLNDAVKTGPGARVQILFNDDSIFSQGEKSEMVIDRYVFNPDKEEDNSFLVRLGKGLFRLVTGKITDLNPDRFEVETGRSTVGIRGCDLGFSVDEIEDVILAARIPQQREVLVDPNPDLPQADPGVVLDGMAVVTVDNLGRLSMREFEFGDMSLLVGGTTPASLERPPADSGGAGGSGAGSHGEGSGSPGSDSGGLGGWFAGLGGDGSGQPAMGLMAPAGGQSVMGAPEDMDWLAQLGGEKDKEYETGLHPYNLPLIIAELMDGEKDSVDPKGDGVSDYIRNAEFMGGGMGADYAAPIGKALALTISDAVTRDLLWIHDSVDFMWKRYDLSDVVLSGSVFDQYGVVIGPEAVSHELQLPVFRQSSAYQGFEEIEQPGQAGVMVACDNLQHFVRRSDTSGTAASIEFWGYAAPENALPSDKVLNYSVHYASYPSEWHDYNGNATVKPFDLQHGTLLINTKTESFYLYPDNPGEDGSDIFAGEEDMLDFFGKYGQGVAVQTFHGPFLDSADGTAAGFRRQGTASSTESGVVGPWKGYAIGLAGNKYETSINETHPLISASMQSSDPVDNEDNVELRIDKDLAGNNVNAKLFLMENQGGPGPNDLNLKDPSTSYFVQGNLYGAEFISANEKAMMIGDPDPERSGQYWSWGMWNGERGLDTCSSCQDHMMGEYVAGNVLSEHEVNSLKDSSIVRDLVGSGPASAFVSRLGEHSLHLNGKSDLAVRLGGGSGTWQGTFNLENPEGDYLSIETMTVDLGPQGHLKIDSPAELARFEGMLRGTSYYSTTELDQAKMTGNLVGPGPGHDRPVTGAIGSGRLKTYDERTIDILHSANLNDRPVAAQ